MRRTSSVATILVFVVSMVAPVVLMAQPASASCATAGCPAPTACTGTPCWHPTVGMRWQYQLQAAKNAQGTACLYPSTGGINTGITAVPKSGGAAVAPQVFDIDYQTDGFCTGGTITQENGAAVTAIHANGAH